MQVAVFLLCCVSNVHESTTEDFFFKKNAAGNGYAPIVRSTFNYVANKTIFVCLYSLL